MGFLFLLVVAAVARQQSEQRRQCQQRRLRQQQRQQCQQRQRRGSSRIALKLPEIVAWVRPIRAEGKGTGFPLDLFGKTHIGGRGNARRFMLFWREKGRAQPFSRPSDEMRTMTEYEKIWDFQNLYKAHTVARRSKRHTREVIDFEMNLGENLTALSDALRDGTYEMMGYYSFAIHDPKYRVIHALHYRDRVVQHCLCDEVLAPVLDNKLVYDNAACRQGKGTHFALSRLSVFLHSFYRRYGTNGYFLKCDIRKFFDNIDHVVLKNKLRKAIRDADVLRLLDRIIDSYEASPGKGLPLGNQTSQWFAIYYLDGLDRRIKEKWRIPYYSRYMDDCVLVYHDKETLCRCLADMRQYARAELKLEFNEKTEIFPLKNGVDYLGWHMYLTETGKVVRRVRRGIKRRYQRRLRFLQVAYANRAVDMEGIHQVISSYHAHLAYGHTYHLQRKTLENFVFKPSVRTD